MSHQYTKVMSKITLIENINQEKSQDSLRYLEEDSFYRLVCKDGELFREVKNFTGIGDQKLQTEEEFLSLLIDMGVTEDQLKLNDNGLFKLVSRNGSYALETSDGSLSITFVPSTQKVAIEEFSNDIRNFLVQYSKYIQYFKKIPKDEGLLVKIPDSVESEWFQVRSGNDYEIFIPKNSPVDDYWLRAYFSKTLDNHSIDLSFKEYGIEADQLMGAYDYFSPIPKDALVELELEDKSVVYLDLYDGIDTDNGIIVQDMNISSQRVIKNIRIYYEINQSA